MPSTRYPTTELKPSPTASSCGRATSTRNTRRTHRGGRTEGLVYYLVYLLCICFSCIDIIALYLYLYLLQLSTTTNNTTPAPL